MSDPDRPVPPLPSAAEPKPRFVRNVFSNWTAFVFSAVVAFFLSPFVVRSLGNTEYGAWVLLGSLVGYMGLLDLGVRGAVTRFIAKFHAEGAHLQSSRLASSALIIFCISGLLALVAAIVLAIFVVPRFRIPPDLIFEARVVMVIGGLSIGVTLINGVLEGIIVGRQRFDYSSKLNIVAEGVRAVLVVAALSAGEGLIALAVIQLAVNLMRAGIAYVIDRRLYPEARIRWKHWDPHAVRLIFSWSFYTVLLQASGQIISYTDSLVISAFLPVALLTFFAIAVNLTNYARAIVRGISFTLTPATSALQAQGRTDELRHLVLKGARFSTLVLLPIVITFILRGGTFIGLWMGPSYGSPSGEILWILAIGLACQGGFSSVSSTMFGLNRHKGMVPIVGAEAAANLGLSIWLVQVIGLPGVAWGTTGPRLVVALIAVPWYLRHVLGVSMSAFWSNAWLRPIVSMVPFVVGTYLVERLWQPPNLAIFFLQVALVLPLAAVGGWFFCLRSEERAVYGAALARRLRRTPVRRDPSAYEPKA